MTTPKDAAALDEAIAKAAGLPRAFAIHTNPDAPLSAEQEPLPAALQKKPLAEKSPAEWAYDRLILYIRNFESQLDSNQEIAMGFAGSDAGVVSIEGLGYYDPDILTFYGRDEEGMKTQLVQHVTQLSVILRAVPKVAPEIPARRIGFHLAPGWTGGEAGDGSA